MSPASLTRSPVQRKSIILAGGAGTRPYSATLSIRGQLLSVVEIMGRGYAWLDTGAYESLLGTNQFIATLGKRQIV